VNTALKTSGHTGSVIVIFAAVSHHGGVNLRKMTVDDVFHATVLRKGDAERGRVVFQYTVSLRTGGDQ